MRRARLAQTLIVVVAASLACQLPGRTAPDASQTPSGQTAATPGAPASPTPASSGTDDPFPEGEPTPPPPQGMFDAMQEKVESGEWTPEEGLIASLQILAGEADPESIFGDRQPATVEGFGTIVEARRYLRTGADEAAKAEMERLLSIVVPDVDRILEYAAPEELAAAGRAGLAAPVDDETCTSIAQKGFPPGSTMICYLFKQSPLGANTVRAFYPSAWGKTNPNLAYVQNALQAVFDSHAVYTQYGKIVSVDVVFTILDAPKASALAEVTSPGASSRCEILIYPVALTQAEPQFKQTVAHEMFHCYQQWQYPAHFDASWSVQDWWGESTAEYFSNVVYPAANDEWPRIPVFGYNSATLPLVEMSYENWIFFQYLANQVGDAGVLSLIQSMPVQGTTADQAFHLAAYPNIEALFHQFGRDFVDKKIVDADKPTIVPTGWLYVPPQFRITIGPGDHSVALLDPAPFVLRRYGLNFAPGRVYSVAVAETGSPGQYASRLFPGPASWNPLPPTVASGCGKVAYYTLVTTTGASTSQPYAVAVTADVQQKTECDECLFGSWELNKDSFIGYMATPFMQTPGFFDPGQASGTWRFTFDKSGAMAAKFDFAFAYALHQGGEVLPLDTDVLLTLEGPAQGLFWIPEDGTLMIQAVENGVVYEHQVAINGQAAGGVEVPFGSPFPSPGSASASAYSCSSTQLFLTPNAAAQAGLPALEYDRVSGP